jgi:glycine/D-amino acid oxidase-like deaminating enzyme
VVATEAYTALLPGHRRDLLPIYSLMIGSEPLTPEQWEAVGLANRTTFADARRTVIYGQRTADGRLAFGGRGAPYHYGSRIHESFDRDDAVRRRLEATVVDLFPPLRDVRFEFHWGGALGVPRDWHPHVSYDRASGLAGAGGYTGDGVATANLAGRTLADLVVGRETELTRLPWVGHRSRRWEPEPLRWLGVRLTALAAQRADAADAAGRRSAAMWDRLFSVLA